MKRAIIVGLIVTCYLSLVTLVSADGVCQPLYGGGQTCQSSNLVINKTVMNPATGFFVDNLGLGDPTYGPDQTVTFQLTVTNTGNATATNITVKDIFPQLVSFTAGPGTFDTGSKTLTIGLGNLNPTESRTITLNGKIASVSQLPIDGNIVCVINQALITSPQNSQDNSQLCIQKPVLGVSVPATTKGGLKVFPNPKAITTPSTGPEAIALFGLIPTGALGLLLRKFSIRG